VVAISGRKADSDTVKPRDTSFLIRNHFPEPLIALLQDEASDVTPSPSQRRLLQLGKAYGT